MLSTNLWYLLFTPLLTFLLMSVFFMLTYSSYHTKCFHEFIVHLPHLQKTELIFQGKTYSVWQTSFYLLVHLALYLFLFFPPKSLSHALHTTEVAITDLKLRWWLFTIVIPEQGIILPILEGGEGDSIRGLYELAKHIIYYFQGTCIIIRFWMKITFFKKKKNQKKNPKFQVLLLHWMRTTLLFNINFMSHTIFLSVLSCLFVLKN